jgi:hypothetical protein
MIVVNLFADHLLALERDHRIRPAEEIWYATTQRPAFFAHAARVIGLSQAEYREFQFALLDGKAIRVKMPRHLDAMVGDRRGRLYAIRNATIQNTRAAWPSGYRVMLADGIAVFVPDSSGNFSVLRAHARAHAAKRSRHPRATTIVYLQPPDPVAPVRASVAVASQPPAKRCGWWCFGLPLDATFPGFLGASKP